MKIKKSVEKSYTEDINLFEEDGNLKVTTTLESITNIIHNNFNPEEIAYFMWMLSDDCGDNKIIEKFLAFNADYYETEFKPEDGYSEIADGFKNLLKEYKR